jgi:uncharacterized SAM-binding protein YcdF (DUF218 family)
MSILFVLVLAAVAAGFLHFADVVSTMVPPDNPKADAIVVLTGGSQRLVQAVQLLKSGAAERLLISGVHPATSSQQIRRMTQGSESLFKCCVDIGHQALDTNGNAYEAVSWIHAHGYRHVLVVTSNYHMPRSLYEFEVLDPQTDFIAYPVVNSDLKASNWLTNTQVLRMMVGEYLKLNAARLRNFLGLTLSRGPADTPPSQPV